ncbi:outer membrane beta-barrel protein [Parabacteroides sp.]
MKTTNKFLYYLLLPLLFGSCAPKVMTDLVQSRPASVTAEEVRLYGVGQAVPDTAELIGRVKVVDGGVSTKCNYDQVVALAKQETAKAGGNALVLTDHRKPSLLGSSCHQIAGNMLWIGVPAASETEMTAEPSTPAYEDRAITPKSPFMHSTFYASIGYAFMTNRFYLPESASGNPKNGLDWQLGYDWVSRSGFGAGLMYSGYKSSYIYSNMDVNVGLAYIAPQFVMKQKVGRWGIEEKIGMGYFKYRESVENVSASLSGFGYNFLFGAEYYLSDHVGIGADIGYIGSSLPKQDNINYQEGEHSGIFRIHLDAGIRFHF